MALIALKREPFPAVAVSEGTASCEDCLHHAAMLSGMAGGAACPLIEAYAGTGQLPAAWTADRLGRLTCSAIVPVWPGDDPLVERGNWLV